MQNLLSPLRLLVSVITFDFFRCLILFYFLFFRKALRTKFLLEARQLKLLSELQAVYPIERLVSGDYAIRGLDLPNDLSSRDDDHVGAALGYVVHLLILMAKYLEISLRYPLVYQSSR